MQVLHLEPQAAGPVTDHESAYHAGARLKFVGRDDDRRVVEACRVSGGWAYRSRVQHHIAARRMAESAHRRFDNRGIGDAYGQACIGAVGVLLGEGRNPGKRETQHGDKRGAQERHGFGVSDLHEDDGCELVYRPPVQGEGRRGFPCSGFSWNQSSIRKRPAPATKRL